MEPAFLSTDLSLIMHYTTLSFKHIIISISLIVSAPQSDVVSDELEDHRALFVIFLIHGVDVSDGFLKGAVGDIEGRITIFVDLPQEHRHVEMQG